MASKLQQSPILMMDSCFTLPKKAPNYLLPALINIKLFKIKTKEDESVDHKSCKKNDQCSLRGLKSKKNLFWEIGLIINEADISAQYCQ